MAIRLVHPASWRDYQLLDSGDGEKLEQFGAYTLIRPEPQAIWSPAWPHEKWQQEAHAHFSREQHDKYRFSDEVKGGWSKIKSMPDHWNVTYQHEALHLTLRLALTNFGHVGIFPEQGDNWNFIYDTLTNWRLPNARVLNLFAYTGAASVVARIAGADVTHVDASRPGLNWANQNMQLNGQDNIRWVYEDALKFVRREVKRGNRYHGIIMDPPPYGRGPEGEKWTLQEKLNELVELAAKLLADDRNFFVLSMYAVGLSSVVGANILEKHMTKPVDSGEFFLAGTRGVNLPMGTFARLSA